MAIIVTGPPRGQERAPDRTTPDRRVPPVAAVIAALALLGAVTFVRPEVPPPAGDPALAIPPSVSTTPLDPYGSGRWVETGVAAGELTAAERGPGGYVLPTRDGIVTITDDDRAIRVGLPNLETLGGIAAGASRVVAYGQSQTGPALWDSPDGLTWTLRRLPWQGAARAVAFLGDRLVVFGISSGTDGLTGVIALEGPDGEWEFSQTPLPASSVTGIPGGFVVRDRHPDDALYRYYVTRDMLVHEPFADRLLISGVGLTAGVIDTAAGPRLVAPPLDVIVDAPDWPVVGLWQEGSRIWLQTAESVWTSLDGERWNEIALDRTAWSGLAIALPVGEDARVVVSEGTGDLRIFRWTPDGA